MSQTASGAGPSDTAGVIAPPPLIALATVLLGLALDWLAPAYVLIVLLSVSERIVLGTILMTAGAALAIAGERAFRSVGTEVKPWKPSTRLATGGIYAWVRNPMYIGLAFLVGGIAIAIGSDWTLVMLVPAAFVIHYGVVLREERYLERKFGADYRVFKTIVPRYGWPL